MWYSPITVIELVLTQVTIRVAGIMEDVVTCVFRLPASHSTVVFVQKASVIAASSQSHTHPPPPDQVKHVFVIKYLPCLMH